MPPDSQASPPRQHISVSRALLNVYYLTFDLEPTPRKKAKKGRRRLGENV